MATPASMIAIAVSVVLTVSPLGRIGVAEDGADAQADSIPEAVAHILISGTTDDLADHLAASGITTLSGRRAGPGYTALHLATWNKHPRTMIAALLDAGLPIDAQDDDGRTPLHHAIDQQSMAAVQILVMSGASLFIKNSAGESPLSFCEHVLTFAPKTDVCKYVVSSAQTASPQQ